ncbi:bifunctional protein-serine/threonine kinase/phosphatase [Photobacterium sp. TY1-4]|uniref:bifunctional protein-serine/threonine kinase/phosphatase n=1 Tax=Photobacterium sp. TY1-4 TaxID=2899122 RepID=UPI0021C25336|nr:bifunctional protein-serine/threonine kinase/phosphatase [Photobacterium sp. TY1-4]UXI02200.1 protein kinase [Photobacterium sp. TY1-4]
MVMTMAADTQQAQQLGLRVTCGGFSSAGCREVNQDAFALYQPPRPQVLKHHGVVACIADGVSCSARGQQASHTCVTQFIEDYYSTPASWTVRQAAAKVLTGLNRWLYHHGQHSELRHNGLVTTFSSVVIKSNTAHVIHVGDSRVYRFRQGRLEQLTRDHCRRQGGDQHLLLRALGMDSKLEVDYYPEPLVVGDVLLLSTDGLHDWLSPSQLEVLLTGTDVLTQSELEALARNILQRARAQGSDDNLTCLLIRIDALPEQTLAEASRALTARVIPPVLAEGQRLDHYQIRRVLHSGTRSHVYLARSDLDQQDYVLKCPSPNFAEDLGYLQGFAREGWVGRQFSHPSVMKIHPSAASSPFLYHVCDFVPGITLRQWMLDHPSPRLSQVRAIAAELIKPIRYFQRMGMVHRDIKPENLILTDDGRVVCIDFGTAQVAGLEEIHQVLTEEIPVGATDYIAPEYFAGNRATSLSDLYSVSVILYEMLTGQLPYASVSPVFDPQFKRHYHYRSVLSSRPDLPVWLDLVLKKACHPAPEARYQVMSEMLQDLSASNPQLLNTLKRAPLLQRNPLRFWQGVSWLLAILVLVESWLLLR